MSRPAPAVGAPTALQSPLARKAIGRDLLTAAQKTTSALSTSMHLAGYVEVNKGRSELTAARRNGEANMKTNGLKIRTNIKAGRCCWNTYNLAKTSGTQADWDKFVDCCNKDNKCTPSDYNLVRNA